MYRLSLVLAAALLTACATPQQMLSTYSDIPETCAEIDQELWAHAEKDATWTTVRTLKDSGSAGVSIAAAAGLIPAGFAWAPLAALVVNQFSVPSNFSRIQFLAIAREQRGCGPLIGESQ